MPPKALLLIAASLLFSAAAAAAEAQDRAGYRAIFERQMETIELGPTRGVRIVPLDQPDAEAVAVEPSPQDGASALDLTADASAKTYTMLPEADRLDMRIGFAFDSAAIADAEKPKLREICGAIEDAEVGQFRIIGHTDATGDAAYNRRLSERRAEEVRRFFMTDCGISTERLEAIGVGKQFPANAADPFAGENRRVEFQAMS